MHDTIQIHPRGVKKMMKKNGEPTKRSLRQTNVKFLFLRDAPPKKIKRGRKKNKKKNIRNAGRKPKPTVSKPAPPKTELFTPRKVDPVPIKGKQRGADKRSSLGTDTEKGKLYILWWSSWLLMPTRFLMPHRLYCTQL